MFQNRKKYDTIRKKEALLCVWNGRSARSRAIREIAGDYAVLENETGGTTEVALALLPDGIAEGTVLIFENFEYRIKENMP